jgi:hypothetical protein
MCVFPRAAIAATSFARSPTTSHPVNSGTVFTPTNASCHQDRYFSLLFASLNLRGTGSARLPLDTRQSRLTKPLAGQRALGAFKIWRRHFRSRAGPGDHVYGRGSPPSRVHPRHAPDYPQPPRHLPVLPDDCSPSCRNRRTSPHPTRRPHHQRCSDSSVEKRSVNCKTTSSRQEQQPSTCGENGPMGQRPQGRWKQ